MQGFFQVKLDRDALVHYPMTNTHEDTQIFAL